MEKYIIWYGLLIKAWVKKKTNWLQLAGMVLIVLLIAGIRIPDTNNTVIGLCNEDGAFAQDIVDKLLEGDSVFQFQTYDSREKMQEAVLRGEIESGFLFNNGMEEKLEKGKKKNLITAMTTPLTTKGAVARETVFAAFLECYSERLLLEKEEQVFGKISPEISELLLEKNREYLNGDELFRIDFEEVESSRETSRKTSETFPVRGMMVLLIFVMVLISHGKKFEQTNSSFEKSLTPREAVRFELLRYLAGATIPAMTGVLLLLVTGNSVGILKETAGMLLFVISCGWWMVLVGKLFHNNTTYASWILTLVITTLLLCPVFVNAAEYVPALGYVSCAFPVGIYLRLFSLF